MNTCTITQLIVNDYKPINNIFKKNVNMHFNVNFNLHYFCSKSMFTYTKFNQNQQKLSLLYKLQLVYGMIQLEMSKTFFSVFSQL